MRRKGGEREEKGRKRGEEKVFISFFYFKVEQKSKSGGSTEWGRK